jgi:magnesium transporter
MSEPTREAPWDRLHDLAESGNAPGLEDLIDKLDPSETLRAFYRLNTEDQQRLVALLPPDHAADLLDDLTEDHAAELLEQLDATQAANIVAELPSDQGADLLSALGGVEASAILEQLQPDIADEVRGLISYSGGVAGSLMGPEYFAYPETANVATFLSDLAEHRDSIDQLPQRIVLLDTEGKPAGAVDIADILLANRDTSFRSIKQPVNTVAYDASLDELETFFDRYETLGAPVVDDNGRLVGRLRRRAVAMALAERAQSDQLKVQGIVGGEELRSMALPLRAGRRLSWLSINILLNILAASVIAFFQDTVSAVIALAVFLPIVSDMSGCSGNQAVAVSLRELTLGIVEAPDVLRVWWQEVSVGLINGLALGLLLAGAAYLWNGSPWLGAVVGVALGVNTIIAVSIGGTVPLILKRFGVDPAVASGPILTTITDMCGFFLVLGLATLALPLLT